MRHRGLLFVVLLVGVFGLLLAAGPAAAAEPSACVVEVEPRAAQIGTEFTLTGSGFTPTQLILQKEDGEPVTIDLDLGDQDPFAIPVGSGPGDEGLWRATVVVAETSCSASATFRVTLLDTATLDAPAGSPSSSGQLPLVLYLVVMAAGFGGGVVLARRTRPA
jgi:hypothetical protein